MWHQVKKRLTYMCLLLALTACDDMSTDTHNQTSNPTSVSQSQLGQLQGALQLSPDMHCDHFTMMNQANNEEELSIDLTDMRLINGQYSFQRALKTGSYTLIGALECTNEQDEEITYESFPQVVNIQTDQTSQVNFDFIVTQGRTLDMVHLQLCAEFALSSISHGQQICSGDRLDIHYETNWGADHPSCHALQMALLLNQNEIQVQDLIYGADDAVTSATLNNTANQATLAVHIYNRNGEHLEIYKQLIDVVDCSNDSLFDRDEEIEIDEEIETDEDTNIDMVSAYPVDPIVADNSNQECYAYTGMDMIQGGFVDAESFISINGTKVAGFEVKAYDTDQSLVRALNRVLPVTLVRADITPHHQLRLVSKAELIELEYFGDIATILGINNVAISSTPCMESLMCVEVSKGVIQGGTLDSSNFFGINGERIAGFEVAAGDSDHQLRNAINHLTELTGVRAEVHSNALKLISAEAFELEGFGTGFEILGFINAEANTTHTIDRQVACTPNPLPLECYQVNLNQIVGGVLDAEQFITINDQKIAGFEIEDNDASATLRIALSSFDTPEHTYSLMTSHDALPVLRSNRPMHIEATENASIVTGIPAGLHQEPCH